MRGHIKLSLLWKLELTIGITLLIVISALASAAYLNVEGSVRARAEDRLERSVAEVSGLLHAAVHRLAPAVLRRAEHPELHAYLSSRNPGQRQRALEALRYDGPRSALVLAVELLDPKGEELLSAGPLAGRTPRLSGAELSAAASNRAGRIVAVNDSAAFPTFARVTREGEIIGLVVIWWRLDVTLRLDGAKAYVGNPVDGTWTDLNTFVPPPVRGITERRGIVWHDRDGSGWVSGLSAVPGTPWMAVVEVAEADILASSQRFLRHIFKLASLLLVAGLLAVWHLSHRIIAPLGRLTTAADAITAGDYAARVSVASHDELGVLAAAFNGMATRVQEAHRKLEQQAVQYEMLFEANPSPMWVYDRETLRFLAVNHSACAQYGYSREAFLSMRIVDIRPEAEIPLHLQHLEEAREVLDTSGLWSHRRADGTIIAAEVTSHEIIFAGRAAVLVLACDVTERRRAQEQLRSAHEELRAIVEAAPVAIYSLDKIGNVRSWNPAAERIFGWSAAEILGGPLPSAPAAAEMGLSDWLRELRAGRSMDGVELEHLRKDGGKIQLRVYAGPLHDADGAVGGMMVAATDMTDVRRLEQQYRHSQKMEAVGRLAGGVAHDFNNLLTVILGESDLALDELQVHPARASLEEISRAARAAEELTRRLLAFSRQQVVETAVFNFNDLVTGVEKMLLRLIGEDINLVTRLAPDAGTVCADYGQFEQLIVNIAVNARDAMPDGGLLSIETSVTRISESDLRHSADLEPGEYVLLAISDSGIGISEENRTRIFEPFFTTKELGRGTGLGLAMCYGIVKQSGGHIEVYSEMGLGTTFKIYLPRVVHAPVQIVKTVCDGVWKGSERILLVEDQAAVRQVTARMLESLGYQVVSASDADEALITIGNLRETIDLLLTDVVLPSMKGTVLSEYATRIRPDLKVVFVSGYTNDVAAYRKLVEDKAVLIQKPFTAAQLGERLRRVLDSASMRSARV